MEGARAIWEELGLAPLTARPPWHGYTLGNWAERWDRYAQRAPSPAPGRRPGSRPSRSRRSDKMPEQPYRTGEEGEKKQP